MNTEAAMKGDPPELQTSLGAPSGHMTTWPHEHMMFPNFAP